MNNQKIKFKIIRNFKILGILIFVIKQSKFETKFRLFDKITIFKIINYK